MKIPENQYCPAGEPVLEEPVTTDSIEAICPLSSMQEGILFHSLLTPDSDVYFRQTVYSIKGELDAEIFEHAWQQVLRRHSILRTAFAWKELGRALQVIFREAWVRIQTEDWTGLPPSDQKQKLEQYLETDWKKGFNLGEAPLLRLGLLRVEEEHYYFVFSFHHLLLDGWSNILVLKEAKAYYDAYLAGTELKLPEPRQYREYLNWLEKQDLGEAEAWWRGWLRGFTTPTPLPWTGSSGAVVAKAVEHQREELRLSREESEALRRLARQQQVTLNTVVQGAWGLLLSRHSGERDVVFGATVSGRNPRLAGVESMVGLFINTLPVRMKFQAGERVGGWLKRLQREQAEAHGYDYTPLGQAQSWSEVEPGRPLFQSLYVFENFSEDSFEESYVKESNGKAVKHPSLNIEVISTKSTQNYPLALMVAPAQQLLLRIMFHGDRFREAAAKQMLAQLRMILLSVAGDPAQSVDVVRWMSQAEQRQVLEEWNQTAVSYRGQCIVPPAQSQCLHELFEAQVKRTPEATAVVYEGEALTYAELSRKANQLARYLRSLGIERELRVGIFLERSWETIVAVLGTLKAGAAYVALDPGLPAERLAQMIEDVQVAVLITREKLRDKLPNLWAQIISIDQDWETIAQEEANNLAVSVSSDCLAYVIFTSGSTGKPKAVGIEHRQICSYTNAVTDRLAMQEGWSYGLISTFAADLGNTMLFPSLCVGGTLHVIAEDRSRDGKAMTKYVQDQGVLDCLKITPTQLRVLVENGGSSIVPAKRLVVGGEATTWEWAQQWQTNRPECHIWNHYGPTESTVGVCTFDISGALAESAPGHGNILLGKPLQHSRLYVLDEVGELVPVDVPGELYIGGEGVGRGYLNSSSATAENFVPDPFVGAGSRLYRTGDRVRWTADGNLEFLGRKDKQVKVRGYRIELGEIESVLNQHSGVRHGAVVFREDEPGQQQLVAYVVPRWGDGHSTQDASRSRLPNGLRVAQQNKNETEYLYREIFENQVYFQHGIELPQDACVFDIGANIGMFTLFIGKSCPNGSIYAFEPISSIFECLKSNIGLIGAHQTKIFPIGLSKEEKTADFTYYPRYSMMSGLSCYSDADLELETVRQTLRNQREAGDDSAVELLASIEGLLAGRFEANHETCQLRRLSDVIHEEGLERIDLLKVDAQRAELDVLLGIDDRDWHKIQQVVMEVHDGLGLKTEGQLQKVLTLLESKGFYTTAEQYGELRGTDRWNLYASRKKKKDRNLLLAPALTTVAAKNPEPVAVTSGELRMYLVEKLPEYMVPAAFVMLDELPLLSNGKLDYKALPRPQEGESLENYKKPRTPIEEILAGIWSEVLKVDQVGIEDNFFVLGGHSLLATQVISRAQAAFGTELSLRMLFEEPTIAGFAGYVERAKKQSSLPMSPIIPVSRELPLPLSFGQQRLWFLQQLDPDSSLYDLPYALRLTGSLDQSALRSALSEIVRRHEILRTRYEVVDGEAVQCIDPAAPVPIEGIDLRHVAEPEAEALALAEKYAQEAFDLCRGPLMRVRLLQLGDRDYVLCLVLHHIASDGWSLGILVREFMELYAAEREQREAKLEELPIQYGDYAAWQREWLEGGELQEQMEYWKEQLAGLETLELPTDHPRPAVMSHRGATVEMELGEELTSQVRELCRREGVTLFMALLAGVQVLLGRYAGQQEVAVGTPIANRTRQEIEPLIGFFVNTLVLRGEVRREWSFREMLKRVREVTLAAYAHQDVPFEQLVEELQPVRDLSRNPLFEVMLIVQNTPQESFRLPGLSVETLGTEGEVAKFDLTFSAAESGGKIRVGINYATELYEQETIERMGGHFRAVVEEMTRNADSRIGEVTILSDAERAQLEGWNRTEVSYPDEKCVHELFEDQVARTPEAVAVEYEDERLNYQELNRRANQLAHYLRSMGVGPEVRVGICMERSLEMVVAIMAVLKAGGAYMPLDPSYPADRLSYMLEDSAAPVLLGQARLQEKLLSYTGKAIQVDTEWERIGQYSDANLRNEVSRENLAYVIYTSGSTGKPKGIEISHQSLANHMHWMQEEFHYGPQDRILQKTSTSFDASVWEFYAPLLTGGQLVLLREGDQRDPECLARQITKAGITVVQMVPSLLEAVLQTLPTSRGESIKPNQLRLVMCGGEVLKPEPASAVRKQWRAEVVNLYGPTECTIDATFWRAGMEWEEERIPIGKPVANMQVYVLDEAMEPVPTGVAGELYIGGAGLARGYLNQPGLTAERFVPNPFGVCGTGERLYRTGDRVRWRSDGNLEYLGRLDQQVKVRGYRIELGEIEAALQKQAGVREAVVVVREDVPGEKRLVAYYTCRRQQAAGTQAEIEAGAEVEIEANTTTTYAVGAEELRRHLAATLPDYMVPAAYVRLQQLPLTANGKLDRKALPQPEGDAYAVRGYQAPVGEVEQKLAVIWAEVLKVERVGRQDNFFALGGHSLLAITLIERMRRSGLGVDVRTLFAQPTLADLAAAILKRPAEAVVAPPNRIPTPCQMITPDMVPLVELTAEEIEQIVGQVQEGAANVQDIYPLAPLQEGIFFHHLMDGGESDPYVAGTLLRFDRRERLERFVEALQKVVDRHDILRTAVLWEGLSQPVQVVQRRARLEVEELADEAQGSDEAGRVEETGVEEDGRGNAGRQDAGQQLYERFHPRRYRMDVRRAPLLRLHVRQDRQDGRWLMVLLLHHLAGDHSTLEMMREEVRAHLEGREKELLVPLPFRNLVAQARLGMRVEEHEEYFRGLLGDVEETTAPFGLMEVQGDGRGIEEAGLEVKRRLGERMRGAARRLGVSVASVCHLAWGRVLAQVTGREQVVFGTVLFGRMQGGEGADRVLGMFMNTLPVRIEVGGRGVEASVVETQRQLAQLMRHEHASLSLAQRCSGVPAPLPLFTALLNYRHSRNVEQAESDAKGTGEAWEGVEWERGDARTNYPLILSVDDLGEGFQLTTQTVEWVGAERVCRYMERALESMVEALEKEPEKAVRSVAVLPEEERQQVVYGWNRTEQEYPQRCVHELFEEQASRTPKAIALEYEGQRLTYRELNRRANQLGHYLRKLGVGPEVRVGICVERSLEMVIGLLGILKAGGAYVPLDPDYPPERLQFMAEDAQVAVLLTEKKFQDLLWQSGVLEICLKEQWEEIAEESEAEVGVHLDPRYLAYVIFTSGSTGRPKGVGVEHRSIVRLVKGTNYVKVKEQDAFLQMAPVSFDAATFEIWGSLLNGCRLVVYPAGMPSLEELGVVVEKSGVTVLWLTAGLFHQMVDTQMKRLQGVRQLLAGGDALSTTHVGRALAELGETCLINGYGPTENTTFSCCHRMSGEVGSELWGTVPIGRPITNSQAYVLDEEMRYEPMPVGVAGELYVGGEGLARGYMNRPELTAEKFVPNPFSERGGERLYRTGDRVRWRGDGSLEFAGRLDHQVKLRGYRIELGEVEAVLRGMAGVKDAAVVMREEAEGDKRLVAYVVMEGEEEENPVDWRGYVGAKLPEYMVPSHFVVLEELPLTPNGKLDRKALPAPVVNAAGTSEERKPESPVEQILAAMYEQVLGVEKVGVEGNFFELGGHSLLATQVISRVRKVFEVELGLRVLFESPTVQDMAKEIEKQLQAGREAGGAGMGVEEPAIGRVKGRGRAPLSYAQQRLWFIDKLEPGSSLYNVPFALRLKGKLDEEALEKSLKEIVRRHEVLRTHFEEEEGEPVQVIVEDQELALEVVYLEEEGEGGDGEKRGEEREEGARKIAREEARVPFDLSRGPLLRARLLRLGAEDHVLLVTMHHIVSDGWSIGVLVREFSSLYEGYVTGREAELAELGVQYADFAVWQRKWLQGEVLERQMRFWRGQLEGVAPLELPTDHPRPAVMSHRGATVEMELGEELTSQVRELCRREGVTLFMALLAGVQVLLGRYAGQQEVAAGTPIANRTRQEIEPLIGFFVNTLVLRGEVRREWSFREMLKRVREVTLAAYAHQDVPFEHLVEELQPVRDLSRNPLFEVMLIVQNTPQESFRLPGLSVETLGTEGEVAKFDLMFSAAESGGKIRVGINYATELYEQETIERMGGHFRAVVEEMTRNADSRIGEVTILSDAERAQLEGWNRTEREYPQRWVHELFEDQVKRTPEAVAVEYEDERLNYQELNRRANQLAHYLRSMGVGPEVRVGICMERSLEMVVAIMAVLKAGGAYMPLDPSYPAERLRYMLEGSAAPVLLGQAHLQEKWLSYTGKTIHVDAEWGRIGQCCDANLRNEVSRENLAYVIYTSGSTGKPKGAMNTHRGLSNRVQWMQQAYGLTAGDRVLQKTPFAFDVSVWEFVWPLVVGARLVMLRPGGHQDPACIAEAIQRKQITTVHFVPAMLRAFLANGGAEQSGSLSRIICSGEALDRDLARECREQIGAELHNLYGPTEASIDVTFWDCSELTDVVRIGRPIANAQIHVLDSELQTAPVGVAGELYIGGAGLARGYVNQAGLTAERFVPDPFASSGGERLYRTGDRVRWHGDGSLEYLGRLDQQVKIHGYRIELGEIEAALQKQAGVREAVVVAREDVPGEKRLVAYVVGGEENGNSRVELNSNELRKQLLGQLPEYMVPSAFVVLQELPLNANGKVDRKRLPEPQVVEAGAQDQKPRTVEEEILCGIWEQVLKVERVGVEENFFAIGGHSLLATQVVSRIREAFGVEIRLRVLFEQPTIAGLAVAVKQARMQQGAMAVTPLVRVENRAELPLSFAQQRLWFLEQMEPGNAAYNVPFALRIRGKLDREALVQSIRQIVERHEVLRTVFIWNREQEPVQRLLSVEEAGVVVKVMELGELAPEQREAEARRLVGVEVGEGFNLSTGPLLRVKLLGMGEQDHVLLVTMHHIVSDGWSMRVLMRDFVELYKAWMSGHAAQLLEMAIQYGDYTLWQHHWLREEVLEKQLGYWRKQSEGLQPLELPADYSRPAVATNKGREITVHFGEDLTHKLKELGRRENATLFMVLLGAFQALLGRYSGQSDLAVGSPILNRGRAELENLIGFFTNTLVLRIDLSGKPSFLEILRRVREMTLGAYEHQDLPFEKLVAELQPERHLSRAPLFQVMFSFNTEGGQRLDLPGLTLEQIQAPTRTVKFDLLLSVTEESTGIEATLQYSTDLFEESRMEKLLCHFQMLLEGIVSDPHRAVDRIPILSAEELQELHQWNCTEAEYPQVCLHELFEEQARETPQAAAVVFGNQQLSYRELDDRANRLARHLRRLGVGPDVRVGICMERCLEMIVGVLGVLKAGGAYVPLDPSYPGERLAFMLHDSCLSILLTQKSIASALPLHDVRALYLDAGWQEEIGRDSTNGDNEPHSFEPVTPDHLAYVIYTSGSTGKPKGVAMPHRPLVNLFVWQRDSLGLLRRPRTLQFSPLSFDASANEAFTTWAMGGTLVLISEEQRRDPAALVEFLDQQQIDSVYLPFIALQQIADECQRTGRYPSRLREVLSTAEPLQITRNVARFFSELPGCRLHNEYGPSETHVVSAWMAGGSVEEWPAWPPIGRPIANTQLYIVDQEFYPAPVGVPGNLYIGGDNVARGYVGRPELTAQRFIPDPFSRIPGARLYETGDQAVYLTDGNIRFLGRADQQVKLRGYRIELGEIESALDEHPGVQQSAVVLQQGANGERQLTAFILIKEGSDVSWEQLRLYLQQKLPDYMVPAAGTFVATLPMTPSGKVDRKKLRETELVRSRAATEPVPPRNPAEKLVAEIWAEVLHRSDIGVETNFFEIGGHSLQATQIIARIRTAFQIEAFPLRRIFQTPTIAGLVQGVEEALGGESVAATIAEAVQEIRALSPEQVEAMLASNQLSE